MITATETAFLAVVRAFLTEEKAALEELAALTEKQWNHLFVLAAQHSLLPAVYDVVGKTPEFAELPDELRRQVKTQAMQSILQQVSRTALFLTDEKELTQLGVQPLVMKGIVCRNLYPKPDLRPSGDEDLLIPEKDFAAVDACFMRKGFVGTKKPQCQMVPKTVMPRKRWATFIRKQGSSMKYIPGCSAQNPLPMVI